MTGSEESPGDRPASSPAEAVQAFLASLERWGLDALPHGLIPPVDEQALTEARAEAERAATHAGRLDSLRELRHAIIEWALGRYREAGLHAVYFSGALEPAEERRQAIEVLLDAATAYLLSDLLPDETMATLVDRLDAHSGGPVFGLEPEPHQWTSSPPPSSRSSG